MVPRRALGPVPARGEAGEPKLKGAPGVAALDRDPIGNETRTVADSSFPPYGAQSFANLAGEGKGRRELAEGARREP